MSLDQSRITQMVELALKVAQQQSASNAVKYDPADPNPDAVARQAALEGRKVATATQLLSLIRASSRDEVDGTQAALRARQSIDHLTVPPSAYGRYCDEASEAIQAFDGVLRAKGSRRRESSFLKDLSQPAQAELRRRAVEQALEDRRKGKEMS